MTGWHQENERKDLPCGCQVIWFRGRWHPALTCRVHWRRRDRVLVIPEVTCRTHRHESWEKPQ
jgi:hypothetical protein